MKEAKFDSAVLEYIFLILFVGKVFAIGPVATMSWWVVTSPIWIPFALIALYAVVCGAWAFYHG